MKLYRYLTILFIILFIARPGYSQKDPFDIYPDTLNKKRLKTTIIAASGAYAVSMVGLYTLWYKDHPQSGFHFTNDNREWKFMDKVGHAFSTYNIGRVGYVALRYSGLSEKKAAWYGGMLGFAYLTVIE
ncbi:MAG: YfiM family protein, partial [Clostridia bacterium]|nr:YfiM family protein [Clostridia bacterium]